MIHQYDDKNSSIYKCYDTQTNKIVYSRDVTFIDPKDADIHHTELGLNPYSHNDQTAETINSDSEQNKESPSNIESNSHESTEGESAESTTVETLPRRSSRTNKGVPPNRYGYDDVSSKYMDWYNNKDKDNNKVDQINAIIEPKTVEEAIDSEYKEQWKQAMNKEFKSLIDNQTWTLCKLPEGRKAR